MKTKSVTFYVCEICDGSYGTAEKALRCESRAVSGDKGAKVGDTVLITQGEGAGKRAKVSSVHIVDMEWGHYRWDQYRHTIILTADITGWGSRALTFDAYELVGSE